MNRSALILSVLILCSATCFAQRIQPVGYFIKDSVKLGALIPYSLSVSYPSEYTVLFPDSSFFYPFELVSKKYFPSLAHQGFHKDSCVYFLRTFSFLSYHDFSLPVFIPRQAYKDSLVYYTENDTLHIVHEINESKSAPLYSYTPFLNLKNDITYPFLFYLQISTIVFLILLLLFTNVIRKKIHQRKIQKQLYRFNNSFNKVIKDYLKNKEVALLKKIYLIWKNFIGRITLVHSLNKTGNELADIYQDEVLRTALHHIESAIYGNIVAPDIKDHLNYLLQFADHKFSERKKSIASNG